MTEEITNHKTKIFKNEIIIYFNSTWYVKQLSLIFQLPQASNSMKSSPLTTLITNMSKE